MRTLAVYLADSTMTTIYIQLLTFISVVIKAQYTTDNNCFTRYPNQVAQCAYAFEHRNYVSEETCLALCLNNLPKCKSVVYHSHVNKCDLYNIEIPTQTNHYPSPSTYPSPQASYPAPSSYPVHSAQETLENQGYFLPPSTHPQQQAGYPRQQRGASFSQFPQRQQQPQQRSQRAPVARQQERFYGRLNNRGLLVPRLRSRRKRNTVASRLRRVVPSPGAAQRVGNHYIFQPPPFSQYAEQESPQPQVQPKPQPQQPRLPQPSPGQTSYVPRVIPPNAQSSLVSQAQGPVPPPQHLNEYPPEVPQYYLVPSQRSPVSQQSQQQSQNVERSQNYVAQPVAQPVGYPTHSQPSYIAVPLYPTPAPATYQTLPTTTITYHLIPGQGYPNQHQGRGYPAPAPSYPAPAHYPAPSYPAPHYPAPSYPAPHYPAPPHNPDPCYGYGPRLGPNYGSNYFVPTGSCAEYAYAGLYAVWNNGVDTQTTLSPSTTAGTRYTAVFPNNNNNNNNNYGHAGGYQQSNSGYPSSHG